MTDHQNRLARLAAFAARRDALFRTADAERFAITRHELATLRAKGVIIPVVRGLYRFAGAPSTPRQNVRAACLGARSDAVASHTSAAALLALCAPPLLPHITVPAGTSARLKIALVHRAAIAPADRAVIDGIPMTSPARTLVDCAGLLSVDALVEATDDALCRPLCSVAGVVASIERSSAAPGRAGVARLRQVLEPWLEGVRPGSPAEMRLVRRIVGWGFPAPVRQHEVREPDGRHAGTIDLAWPDQLLGLEYDSLRHHNPRHAQHDLDREDRLRRLGWTIERVDRHDVQPSATRLHQLLSRWFEVAA